MKQMKLLLTVALVAAAMPVVAEQVTPEQALRIAEAHQLSAAPRRAPGAAVAVTPPSLALTARNGDYYVFNTDGGFVVVAGDDRAVPVLAYGDRGAFDPDNMPDGMRYMLDCYAAEMALLRATPELSHKSPARQQVRDTEVKPLLKSNWGQREPYNRFCPVYEGDEKCATGCVATSAAQLAYYHRCPSTGDKTYEWDNMLDNYIEGNYTDEQAEAVAQLMSDLGKSAGMSYGKTSSVSDFKMMMAMRDEYGFSKGMRYNLRATKTVTEWENMLVAELDAKRPVLYGGFTQTGGHSFLIDGYNKDGYFHVNWGWNSLSNGYFLLSILSPRAQGTGSYSGGYNGCQAMVIGIRPDDGSPAPENSLMVTVDDFGPEREKDWVMTMGEAVTFSFTNLAAAGYGYGNGIEAFLAYVLTDVSDNNPKILSQEANYNLSFGSRNATNTNRFDVTTPADLAPGEYHLHMMYKCPKAGIDNFRPIDRSKERPGYLVARVADGKMTLSRPNAGHAGLRVVKFDLPQTAIDRNFIIVPITIANDGEEYCDNINIAIKAQGETEFTDRYVELINLPKGREITFEIDLNLPRPIGTHYIMLRDINGRVLDGPRTLVTEAADAYTLEPASQLTIEEATTNHVKASIDVKNSGSKDFNGYVYYRIKVGSQTWATDMTPPVSIPVGETRTVTISTPFEGRAGVEYTLTVYSLNAETAEAQAQCVTTFKMGTATAVDDLNDDSIGISVNGGVMTVSGADNVAIYNVAGALVSTAPVTRLPRGIYIVVADGSSHKIVVD